MSRQDRFIENKEEIIDIIKKCQVIHVGIHDGEDIYMVPLNYGYTWENEQLTFYMHGAVQGKKIDLMKENPRVGFCIDCDHELLEGNLPCQFGYKFASVVGNGIVEFIEEPQEKIEAMKILMKQYSNREFEFNERLLTIVSMFKIKVTGFTGKARRV